MEKKTYDGRQVCWSCTTLVLVVIIVTSILMYVVSSFVGWMVTLWLA